MSTKSSRHGATPNRNRLLVPSKPEAAPWPEALMPFSLWMLPAGTTRLELVTSGRSVAISDRADGHSPACAAPSQKSAIASQPNCKGGRSMDTNMADLGRFTGRLQRVSDSGRWIEPAVPFNDLDRAQNSPENSRLTLT
jgi:hypothetical protein